MYASTAAISSSTDCLPSASSRPSSAYSAEPLTIGMSSPGNSYCDSSSRTSSSTSSNSSGSSTWSTLFRYTTSAGTPTWRASRMCSRVCGIGPSAARDHQDRPVHLRRPGDHVLDVIRVPRAVDVRVVPLLGLVLDVRGVDRDPARLLLRRLVDLVVAHVGRPPGLRQNLGDRRGQRRLAVVHVPDRPHVRMRLRPLKLRLRHGFQVPRLQGRQPRVGAGDGNRTHTASLEGWSSTIELHPHRRLRSATSARPTLALACPARTGDLVEGVGFEPTYAYAGRFTVCCL